MTAPRRIIAHAAAILTATILTGTAPAQAWTAYGTSRGYIIVCADGTLFAYSGRRGDLALVGPRLCSGRGGVAGGDGSGPQIARADRDFERHWLRHCRGGGVQVQTAFGPAERVTCRLSVYPDGSPAPGQNTNPLMPGGHDSSRSRVRD